jgi:NAD(P)-dependent dehydrogenase (short-subunit alcohol dehydrogenase family)
VDIRYTVGVVTGAGGGLGREIAVGLARRGAAVLVTDRDLRAAEQTAALVREARVHAWALQCDVGEEGDVRALAARARDLGGADVLVNNAGGWTEAAEQYPLAPAEAWSRTLEVNLRAPMLLTQLFLEDLPRRRGPDHGAAVVNIASSAGVGTTPYASPEYAAAKAALVRFTSALGDPTVAGGARVMAVAPGWIGLPRAEAEWAALPAAERETLPPLIPPGKVVRVVLDLIADGAPGQVVTLEP